MNKIKDCKKFNVKLHPEYDYVDIKLYLAL
mgnify:FL=1